jgi:hypothetical protein
MNIVKLKELCNKYTVEVSFNGFCMFFHKVINADKLLSEIHLTSTLSKENFIKNINEGNYMFIEYEDIFKNIKSPHEFIVQGQKNLNGCSYIECKQFLFIIILKM